ncbi:unnamed protein product [Cylicocyclus nassatus]|uniref:Uncharacterized protein n=1 Tax=Cylicocyclus nassatus TaxID=53992 RepID=A0AA36DIZ0_CYLNA|nr:unnamed protein product [Cylicocyclus nassatus]
MDDGGFRPRMEWTRRLRTNWTTAGRRYGNAPSHLPRVRNEPKSTTLSTIRRSNNKDARRHSDEQWQNAGMVAMSVIPGGLDHGDPSGYARASVESWAEAGRAVSEPYGDATASLSCYGSAVTPFFHHLEA